MIRREVLLGVLAVVYGWGALTVHAQLSPEIGYVYPPGGQAGTTVDVILGGYDWVPDMQIFVHDPRIRLEILGPPTGVLVPDPPYWFGAKARGPAWPLPREFKARLTIPGDVPAGLVRWQVANANGASPPGLFHVGSLPEVTEVPGRSDPQPLPPLPVTVNGQIRKIEEVDQYEISGPNAGPVTIQLLARQLGSPLHALIQVRDADGRKLVDAADTEGRDMTLTFAAEAGKKYVVSLHDLDYAGDRSYIYRLTIAPGPQVMAAFPSAGRRGETRKVEFVGMGLATGSAQRERVTREVTFPAAPDGNLFAYRVDTPFGTALPFSFVLSDVPELVEEPPASQTLLGGVPCAITGTLESPFGADRYAVELRKDDHWRISAQSRISSSMLDLDLVVIGPDGKEIATNDDASPNTTDSAVSLKAPTDGTYQVIVTDRSGRSGSATACYRLSIEREIEDFAITMPAQLSVQLGGQAKLPIKVVRNGGFRGPIPVKIDGLPEGVRGPSELIVPADSNDLSVDLECSPDVAAGAALCHVTASATINDRPITRRTGTLLLAIVMRPRCKIIPEGLDDVRKVQRGSTHPAPLIIERLEGYEGEIVLEMTSKQQRHRQGLSSGELTVRGGETRVEYPIFIPEWMETTKTSRMILNGVVRVADPKGNVRTLVNRMELRIGILPEGALMKLAHTGGEPEVELGGEFRIPVSVSRTPDFREPVRIELLPAEDGSGPISAEPITLAPDDREAILSVRLPRDPPLCGERSLRIRATALKNGQWPVMSETTVLVNVRTPRPTGR